MSGLDTNKSWAEEVEEAFNATIGNVIFFPSTVQFTTFLQDISELTFIIRGRCSNNLC